MNGVHPFNLDANAPSAVARWRPLFNWVLVIPHSLWLVVLGLGSCIVVILSWFAILVTGGTPTSWSDYVMGVIRYQWRVTAYLYAWTDRPVGFTVRAGHVDPGDYPATLYCARPLQRNRLTVLLRGFMVIPHALVLYFVGIVAALVAVVAWFVVLLTGRWPDDMRTFIIGYFRWNYRVHAYASLVTDAYPPFGFEA